MASSMRCCLAVLTVVLLCLGGAAAQMMELRADGGTCMHSGLSSDLKDCGFRSDWYAYVFVGSISAITLDGKDEKKIQITPEEVFHGNPSNPLTVQTLQGACLPTIAVGDHWLFFLRRENGKPIVLDYYGNDSRPVADAQEQIETLRRLLTIGDFGILRGHVQAGTFSEGKAVSDAHIVARQASDNMQFATTTDADGRYQFVPLPPGKYKLTVDPIGSFHPDDSEIELSRGACWDLTLSRYPHAHLGGHVRRTDGSPVPRAPVLIISEDGSGFITEESDADGYFHSDGMQPGRYMVGINLPGAPAWKYGGCGGACKDKIPSASLYYPGALNRSDALVISLITDQKRDDIDFTVPSQ
jgi:hypothetical protein